MIDARGTVISKVFQGRHGSASYVCVYVFKCVIQRVSAKGETCLRLTTKNQCVFLSRSFLCKFSKMSFLDVLQIDSF